MRSGGASEASLSLWPVHSLSTLDVGHPRKGCEFSKHTSLQLKESLRVVTAEDCPAVEAVRSSFKEKYFTLAPNPVLFY